MPTQHLFSFEKGERIYRKKQIEQIFSGGKSRAFSAFPIKMVYCSTNRRNKEAQVQVLLVCLKGTLSTLLNATELNDKFAKPIV